MFSCANALKTTQTLTKVAVKLSVHTVTKDLCNHFFALRFAVLIWTRMAKDWAKNSCIFNTKLGCSVQSKVVTFLFVFLHYQTGWHKYLQKKKKKIGAQKIYVTAFFKQKNCRKNFSSISSFSVQKNKQCLTRHVCASTLEAVLVCFLVCAYA